MKKLAEQDKKLDEVCRSVERMRKYFLWTLIVTIATVILPLIGLAIAIPMVLRVFSSAYGDLLN